MDTYTEDYDTFTDDYDPEDFDIDYNDLAEMAEDYGYGAYVTQRADDYGFDADNPNY